MCLFYGTSSLCPLSHWVGLTRSDAAPSRPCFCLLGVESAHRFKEQLRDWERECDSCWISVTCPAVNGSVCHSCWSKCADKSATCFQNSLWNCLMGLMLPVLGPTVVTSSKDMQRKNLLLLKHEASANGKSPDGKTSVAEYWPEVSVCVTFQCVQMDLTLFW